MYVEIKELINNNSIEESLILLNNLIKNNIEEQTDNTNEHIKLLFLLIKCFYIKKDNNEVKKYFLILESKIENKIFLDNALYETIEIEELINLYFEFSFNFLEDNINDMENNEYNFYLNRMFDFLSNLYNFDDLNIENKYYFILESWTQFNGYNLKKDFNIKNYYQNTTKLLKLTGFFKYIFTEDYNNLKFNKDLINILSFFNDKELVSLSKILHNYCNTFIELKNEDINKILKFNMTFSHFLINKDLNFSNFIFFFLISNINYYKYYINDNKNLDFFKKEIKNVLKDRLISLANYDIFYKKILFLNKTNVDKDIIDYLFKDFIELK